MRYLKGSDVSQANNYIHYHTLMLPRYESFIGQVDRNTGATITPEYIQAIYQNLGFPATKLFLNCTIDEAISYGYGVVPSFNHGVLDFNVTASNTYAEPRVTQDGEFAIPAHGKYVLYDEETNITSLDPTIAAMGVVLVEDDGNLFPEVSELI